MVLIKDLSADPEVNVAKRPTLEKLAHDGAMGRGRFKKIYSMLYEHGPMNGTFLTLPFDQLIEHGPGHQFKHATAAEAESVIELANRGEFSALVLSIGQAEKYQHCIRPDLPLIIKIDGHIYVGKEVQKYHPRPVNMSSIERALKAGADAIGIAWYPGEIETGADAERIAMNIEIAHDYELPVVLWSYDRGPTLDKIQADNLACCHYAASLAETFGADIVKVKFPQVIQGKGKTDEEKKANYEEKMKAYKAYLKELGEKIPEAPDAYTALEPENPEKVPPELHAKRVSLIANVLGRTLGGFSGGAKAKDPVVELLVTTEYSLNGGMEGRIAGRNMWGSEMDYALDMNKQVIGLMRQKQFSRNLTEPRFTGNYTRR